MAEADRDAASEAAPATPAGVPLALAVLAAACVLVLAVTLAFLRVQWSAGASTQTWSATQFGLAGGQGVIKDGAWIVDRSDANGAFILALPAAQLNASDYAAIDVEVRGLGERNSIAVFWRSRLGGGRTFTQAAQFAHPGVARAYVRRDPNWNGPVNGLGVIIAGGPPPGAAVLAVRAVGASPMATTADLIRSWFAIERWNNQSINVVFLGGQYQAMPFTLFAEAATLLALGAWLWLARGRPLRSRALGAAAIAAVAWLAVDLRWLGNFGRVEADTIASLGGMPLRERKLAAPDGPLFAFIERAQEYIGREPGRVFFSSDDAWLCVRGGYHLLPQRVLAIAGHRFMYPAARYRPGDWLCFYARAGVHYDAATRTVRIDDGDAIKVQAVLVDGLGALYRVRP